MPADVIRARQGDTVDVAIWRERGRDAADIAAVLAANPGLADLGPVLPTGTAIIVPAAPAERATLPTINLWS
jgi:phage tail protein X